MLLAILLLLSLMASGASFSTSTPTTYPGINLLKKISSSTSDSQLPLLSLLPSLPPSSLSALSSQILSLSASYPGGLASYITKSQLLLQQALAKANPFTEYTPSVPQGATLDYATPSYAASESLGLSAAPGLAFVLVAGGLGERLGYSGIKISLEPYTVSGKSYIELYCDYLLALSRRTGTCPPLCIMTSGDTDALTRAFLLANNNFGLPPDNLDVVVQEKVPAVSNVNGELAYTYDEVAKSVVIDTKPHGHGDVHHLLLKSGVIDKWAKKGVTHVAFLQDTNALVTNGILATLGVSVTNKFAMNTICVPRLAGEAAGAIASLEHNTDARKSLVINVEYNMLDSLLKATGEGKGDVSDETGYSPYPGNSNNFILEMGSYLETLKGPDEGVVTEFVNPKIMDDNVTFKKPTRLECMMQDLPWLLQKTFKEPVPVGFTQLPRWLSFSPAKNSLESGQEAVLKGSESPGTLSSAESEGYLANVKKLQAAGNKVATPSTFCIAGINVIDGARVTLGSNFAVTHAEVSSKITASSLSARAWLEVEGSGVRISNLTLDGAMVVKCCEGATLTIEDCECVNEGWAFREVGEGEGDESDQIRGYVLEKPETTSFVVEEAGDWVVGTEGKLIKR